MSRGMMAMMTQRIPSRLTTYRPLGPIVALCLLALVAVLASGCASGNYSDSSVIPVLTFKQREWAPHIMVSDVTYVPNPAYYAKQNAQSRGYDTRPNAQQFRNKAAANPGYSRYWSGH